MNIKDFNMLFSNLCCSKCRNDFNFEDLIVKESKGNLLICSLVCSKCGKDFGDIILNFNRESKSHEPFVVIDGPPPITFEDVIDAHDFIKNKL